jgi:hypothetical protein
MGTMTTNGWFYIPTYGAKGVYEYNQFSAALVAADALLGTIEGDPHNHSVLYMIDGTTPGIAPNESDVIAMLFPVLITGATTPLTVYETGLGANVMTVGTTFVYDPQVTTASAVVKFGNNKSSMTATEPETYTRGFFEINPLSVPDSVSVFMVKENDTCYFCVKGSGDVGVGINDPDGKLDLRDGNLVLSDADVDHGMTALAATNVYGKMSPTNATAGGLTIMGLSDTDSLPLVIRGVFGTDDPADTFPAIMMVGGKKNGTTYQALGSSETVFQLWNYTTPIATALGSGYFGFGTVSPAAKMDLWDGSFYMSDTDVAHGMTSIVPTNVFAKFAPLSGTAGGLGITGLSDTDAMPLALNGVFGSDNPTDTTAAVNITGQKKSGTGAQVLGGNETVLQIFNLTTPIATLMGDGSFGVNAIPASNIGFQAASPATAASTYAVGTYITHTLTATANDDTLYGMYLGITYDDNSKTGVNHICLRTAGRVWMESLPTYADNATAAAAGLEIGELYQKTTGELMIRYAVSSVSPSASPSV